MSDGIRSGVNWIRLKSTSRIRASVLTISVFARPGTPSSRQWPRVKIAAKICSITSSCPTITFCNSSCISAMLAEFLQDVAQISGFGGQSRFLSEAVSRNTGAAGIGPPRLVWSGCGHSIDAPDDRQCNQASLTWRRDANRDSKSQEVIQCMLRVPRTDPAASFSDPSWSS